MAQTIIDKATPKIMVYLDQEHYPGKLASLPSYDIFLWLYQLEGRLARRLDLVLGDRERSEATQTDGNSRDEIKLFVLFCIILLLLATSCKKSIEVDIVNFSQLDKLLMTGRWYSVVFSF